MRRTGELLVVANPAAGGTSETMVGEIASVCRRHAAACTVRWSTGPGDARTAAAASGHDLIVAVGGDGTISEVAAGLAGRQGPVPVLVPLPAGSGNSFCKGLWGDRDWRSILASAFDERRRHVRRLDLLRMSDGTGAGTGGAGTGGTGGTDSGGAGRAAVLGISAGFLAEILAATPAAGGGVDGADRYRAGAATVLAAAPSFPARVTVDGSPVHKGETCLVNAGGGRLRGAGMLRLMPRSVLDDGLLDVCVVAGMTTDELTGALPLMMTGRHLDHPGVSYARGRRVVLERTDGKPLVVEVDGELLPRRGPVLSVEVVPGAVGCLAPATAVDG